MYGPDADLPLTADDFDLVETSYDEKIEDEAPVEEDPRPVVARADYGWPVG
jgi:hypothetical protein